MPPQSDSGYWLELIIIGQLTQLLNEKTQIETLFENNELSIGFKVSSSGRNIIANKLAFALN